MCGICGIVDFAGPVARDDVERMTSLLQHRGPDDVGIEMRGAAGLGFRRLSIIDLAGSHQPMPNEDETLWLVFNGEIYNFQPLRAMLLARGHRFRTTGDGETILHLYEEYGLDFVDHLNGMFAVAIWDERQQRLVLARDRLGVKPVYYALSPAGDRLAFASETKALLELPWLARTLDPNAITAFMNFSSVPGEMTCFREVRKLLPGHVATFERGRFDAREYWDVSFERQRTWAANDLLDELDALLRDSVRLRLISDVPLGVFLSGGVDSGVVAAIAAQCSSGPVEAFSVGYGSEGAYMDELPYARAVAERYGMHHHALVLEPAQLLSQFERVTWFLDEPCGDPAAFLTLALSEFARRHVTTSLSGLGGDELFGGYRRYLAAKYQRQYLRLPSAIREGVIRPMFDLLPENQSGRVLNGIRLARKFVRSVGRDARTTWAQTTSYLPSYPGAVFAGAMESVTRDTFRDSGFEGHWQRSAGVHDPVDRAMYMDTKMYLPDQLLLLQDKMSMAVSLEAREPLLDYRLVELAATIPAGLKIRGTMLKAVFKRVAERYLPSSCIYREKKGFAPPLQSWLRGPLRETVYDTLTPARVQARGIFQVAFVEWLKREFYQGGRDLSTELYQVLLLERWMCLYVDGAGYALPEPVRPAARERVAV